METENYNKLCTLFCDIHSGRCMKNIKSIIEEGSTNPDFKYISAFEILHKMAKVSGDYSLVFNLIEKFPDIKVRIASGIYKDDHFKEIINEENL